MVAKSGDVTKSLEMRPLVNLYRPVPTDNSCVGVVMRVTSQSGSCWQVTTVAHSAVNSTCLVAMVTGS